MQQGLIWLVIVVAAVGPALAAPFSVDLGTARSFGLLGGTISNTETSVFTGNVGVKDASGTITGFPPGTTAGGSVIAPGTTSSNDAYIDFVNAFNAAELWHPRNRTPISP